jgi:RNA polymerase primary sigma factor
LQGAFFFVAVSKPGKEHTMRKDDLNKSLIDTYLHEIERVPVMSREDEVRCAKRAEAGDEKAREKLVLANLRFVVSIAVRYQNLGLPLLDLINEGNIGLMKAAEKFDWRRDVKFISYARWWIRHYILRALFEQRNVIKLPFKYAAQLSTYNEDNHQSLPAVRKLKRLTRPSSLDVNLSVEEDSEKVVDMLEDTKDLPVEENLLRTHLKEKINQCLDKLKPIERSVINWHFGLNGERSMTLREIGERFNLTKERIRQIEKAGLEKVRYPMEQFELFDFLSA